MSVFKYNFQILLIFLSCFFESSIEYQLENTYYSLGHFSLNKTANDSSNYQNNGIFE